MDLCEYKQVIRDRIYAEEYVQVQRITRAEAKAVKASIRDEVIPLQPNTEIVVE